MKAPPTAQWLQVTTDELYSMFEATMDAILVIDDLGAVLAANRAAAELVGLPRHRLVGMRTADVVVEPAEDDAPAGRRWLDTERGSVGVTRPDGSVREVAYTVVTRAIRGHHIAFMRDVTEAREAEREVRASQARYRFLVEHTHDVITAIDGELRIRYESPSITVVLGYDQDELVGSPALDLVHPDDREAVALTFQRALADPSAPTVLRFRYRHKDGSWRVMESRGLRAGEAGDGVVGVVSSRDVTDQDAAESALRETRDTLRAVFDASPLSIMSLDTQRRATSWNPAAERTFGWTAAEVIGRELPFVPESERPMFDRRVGAMLRGHPVPPYEAVRARRDGHHLDVRISTAPLFGVDGRVSGIVGIVEDVTERKADEARLARTLEELQAEIRARRALAARVVGAQEEERKTIAAEINDDPLQAMAATLVRLHALARATHPDGEDREALEKAQRTVEEAIARLRRLMFELRPAVLDREGLRAAVLLYAADLERETGIRIAVRDELLSEPAPEPRATMYRILVEALSNVRKHARATSAEVFLGDADGGILATVTDDGIGFDPERIDDGLPEHRGLPSMRERAELIGGTLTVRSTPGSGTSVTVWIPPFDAEAD